MKSELCTVHAVARLKQFLHLIMSICFCFFFVCVFSHVSCVVVDVAVVVAVVDVGAVPRGEYDGFCVLKCCWVFFFLFCGFLLFVCFSRFP